MYSTEVAASAVTQRVCAPLRGLCYRIRAIFRLAHLLDFVGTVRCLRAIVCIARPHISPRAKLLLLLLRQAAASRRCRHHMHRVARLVTRRSIMGSVVGRITEETPAYEVLAADNFQVRRYAAGTAVEASDANNQAFGALAKYIGVMSKPQNARGEAISMTAPVVSIPDEGDAMRMQFVLPSALADAPEPTAEGRPARAAAGADHGRRALYG